MVRRGGGGFSGEATGAGGLGFVVVPLILAPSMKAIVKWADAPKAPISVGTQRTHPVPNTPRRQIQGSEFRQPQKTSLSPGK